MWDLDTLGILNQQAHERAVQRAEEKERYNTRAPSTAPVFPLSLLSRRLITGPPSLGYILNLLENSELTAAFNEMVREYLPEHEEEIRVTAVDNRINLFRHYFEPRYFPLHDLMEDDSLEEFVRMIPVELRGFTYEDYHEFSDFRVGYILLFALIESLTVGEDDDGGRVPLITHVSDLFGSEIAGLIPEKGFTPKQLHELTDGTKFDGAGVFADWVHCQTECWVLDANYEDYTGEPWDPAIVRTLAEQWPRVCEIEDIKDRIANYIEENPKKRFVELLNILLDINANELVIPDEQMPLPLDDKGQVLST